MACPVIANDHYPEVNKMYKWKQKLNKKATRIISVTALCFFSTMIAEAETLGQRAIYNVNIVVETDPTSVGLCSSFDFGDATLTCNGTSKVTDNVDTNPALLLSGGNGVIDGFGGVFVITTDRADALGNNTFTIDSLQMDPYLNTAGGTFKTSMTPPDGMNTGTGTITAAGDMVLNPDGRVGVAASFVFSIGIQPWNLDDSTLAELPPPTNVHNPFVTGTSTNFLVGAGSMPGGAVGLTLTGRAIGDANTDGILDAILVSAGNIGTFWQFFEGTAYSEVYNIQFVLVSAEPVAVADLLARPPAVSSTINKTTDLLANDIHADPAETISFFSFTQPADGTLVESGNILTYTPAAVPGASDTFDYTITDIAGNMDTVTVTINLPVTPPPTANDDPVVTDEDIALVIDPTLNDTVDAAVVDTTITVQSFDLISQQGGSITAVGNDLTYTPAANFFGSDQFNYVILDSVGNIANADVLVTVNSINDIVTCNDVSFTTARDEALDIDVATEMLATTGAVPICTDADGDTVSLFSVDSGSANGGNITNNAGTLTYTPPSGFEGLDTFTYVATDGTTPSVVITATVNVADPNLGNFTMLNTVGNTFGGTNDVVFEWDGTFNTSVTDTNVVATMRSLGNPVTAPDGHEFFGSPWFAHHIRMFGPGTYTFDTTCSVSQFEASGTETCNGPLTTVDGNVIQTQQFITITVAPGQVLAHILFDYSVTANIDVFNLYELNTVWNRLGGTGDKNKLFGGPAGVAPDEEGTWERVNIDGDGDGIVGIAMIDGSFIGFSANFNIGPSGVAGSLAPITTEITSTKLGSSSLSIWSLIAVMFSIVGFRQYRIIRS
ncbi:MAG: hypothetical protein COA54_01155 [Thiotrichaceae bacterium]|nr:MAG: hypothetical protein COA54_01155 [Thiotrichaceae bacterium]